LCSGEGRMGSCPQALRALYRSIAIYARRVNELICC
jgi:hypothetical protein